MTVSKKNSSFFRTKFLKIQCISNCAKTASLLKWRELDLRQVITNMFVQQNSQKPCNLGKFFVWDISTHCKALVPGPAHEVQVGDPIQKCPPTPPPGTKCCLLNRPSFLLLMPLCHFRVGSSFISTGLLSNRPPLLHCLCFLYLMLLFSQEKSYKLTLAILL